MAEKLTTVYHPTIQDMQGEVPSGDVESWVEQGWKKSKPKSAVPSEDVEVSK